MSMLKKNKEETQLHLTKTGFTQKTGFRYSENKNSSDQILKKQVLVHGKTGFTIETGFRYFEKQKTGKQVLDHPVV